MRDKEIILRLRDETGACMSDCNQALYESKEDFEQAKIILRTHGPYWSNLFLVNNRNN